MKSICTFLIILTVIQLGSCQFLKIRNYIRLYDLVVKDSFQNQKFLFDYILNG